MLRTPLALAAATAIVLTASMTMAASPALADSGDCSVFAGLPDTYTITSETMSVPVAATDRPRDCLDWAAYDIVREDGAYTSTVIFDTSWNRTWYLGTSDGPGEYTATFSDGYDWNSDSANGYDSNTMVAKFGSRMSLWRAVRRGSKVSLSLQAWAYSYDGGWGPAVGARVAFQKKTPHGWQTLSVKRGDEVGDVQLTVKSKRAAWRAVMLETTTRWSSTTSVRNR